MSEKTARYALFAGVAAVLALAAEPPARGSAPIEADALLTKVPARDSREGRALAALEHDPLELARAYIEASRRDGDPRYLGLAEGALLGREEREARVLRATILQSRHAFPEALTELDAVLRSGEDPQARLTQATILTVLAEYDRARESCGALPPSIYRTACAASIDWLTGSHAQARAALAASIGSTGGRFGADASERTALGVRERAAAVARGERAARSNDEGERAAAAAGERVAVSAGERAWLLSLLGEQAYWLGDAMAAEELEASLALADDRYTRGVLDDLRLDRGEAADSDDLHRALSELARGEPGEFVARVEASFADSEARGDRVHQREEARFWLARGERARALRLAQQNWSVQREPWDARVLLEAASTRAEAAPALAWLERTHFASPHLRALANELEAR